MISYNKNDSYKKNKFYENDKQIILKGFSIADPFRLIEKDKQKILTIIKRIKKTGANVIRIPIMSGIFEQVSNYLEEYIRPTVIHCEKEGIYAILDWHGIGNPLHNQTRLQEYHYKINEKIYYPHKVDLNQTKRAWNKISKMFKMNNVLFEIFNEPAPSYKDLPQKNLLALPWEEYKEQIEEIISIIRKNAKQIVLVGPPNWAYDLHFVKEIL